MSSKLSTGYGLHMYNVPNRSQEPKAANLGRWNTLMDSKCETNNGPESRNFRQM
jgi:hypothetical protein